MKRKQGLYFILLCMGLSLLARPSAAQFAVIDPASIASGIINATNEMVHTSSTAATMLNNFREVQKVYNQSKAYYDALKSVHSLVRDARRVQQTILMAGEISDIYMDRFQRMMVDPNFTVDELVAIADGYAILLKESADVLTDLKSVVNVNGLSMNDKERLDIIDKAYGAMTLNRNLVRYYSNRTAGVSYLRGLKAGDAARVASLYGMDERYW